MPFPTGHNQPASFVAGQLKDGSSFGTIDAPSFNGQPVKFKIDLRWYKSTLIAVVTVLKADGTTVIEQPSIKQSGYLNNIVQLALPNNVSTLKDLANLVATESKLQSIGLASNQLVPVNATGESIPFEQTADGKVQAYVSAADTAKAAQEAAKQQTAALQQLTNNLTGGTSTSTTGGTSGGMLSTMTTTTKVIIGVVVAVVVGGIIYLATKKKKGGKR
ncbi:hypothetical protein [Spirosoma pomorum]